MLRFISQKIKNQIWLSLCLLLGLSLLVAIFVCQAMFQRGSLDRVIRNHFALNAEYKQDYPALVSITNLKTDSEVRDLASIVKELDDRHTEIKGALSMMPILSTQRSFSFNGYLGKGEYSRADWYYQTVYMPDLENHIEIVDGECFTAASDFKVIITEKTMDERCLTVGEEIVFKELKNKDGESLKLNIVGVYKPTSLEDRFWCASPYRYMDELFVSQASFEKILTEYQPDNLAGCERNMMDYNALNSSNFYQGKKAIEEHEIEYNFEYVCRKFDEERWSVVILFFVMEIPIIAMVLSFIYMVSSQIAQRERSEIAMLKSRGIKRKQVISLYFVRTCFLAIVAYGLGIPIGYALCKLAARATDFMIFTNPNTGIYGLHYEAFLYGLGSVLVGIVCIMLPVFKHSKLSIVEYTADYSQSKTMIWQKCFIDVILLALSIYLVVTYKSSLANARETIVTGGMSDPLIFANSCVFLLAAALFVFRLMQYLVRIVYTIGKKRWKTVAYAAFLQILRSVRKQMFITIFMIVTVGLGLFYAGAARTMNHNKEVRIAYDNGGEVIFQEHWNVVPHNYSSKLDKIYIEPDYGKYENLVTDGICDSYTRVLTNRYTKAIRSMLIIEECNTYAIDPYEFGKTIHSEEEMLNGEHWYTYLNLLSQNPNGVIVSTQMAENLKLEVGSMIRIEEDRHLTAFGTDFYNGNVIAIVDSFPGINSFDEKNGGKSFAIINMPTYMQSIRMVPYEIWVDLKEGVTPEDLEQYLADKGIILDSFYSTERMISEMKLEYKMHITNGLFSLTFLIAIGLCGIGFLIYWMSSIRQRELLFGVYRAMGLSVREINRMLIWEHVFSTFLSLIGGGVVGFITIYLFAETFAMVYLPEASPLPIRIYMELGDIRKLFAIIIAVIIVCILILRRQIKKMNIAQALKMGED